MSNLRDERPDDPRDDRDSSNPLLMSWWGELPVSAKLLIPTTAALLIVVSVSAIPPVLL